MGHWSTYRRRGSTPSAADVLPLPLTPVLTVNGTVLATTAANGNVGGTLQAWTAVTEFGTYSLARTAPWTTVVNMTAWGEILGKWVKCLNKGDGFHRSNQSPFSNALFVSA